MFSCCTLKHFLLVFSTRLVLRTFPVQDAALFLGSYLKCKQINVLDHVHLEKCIQWIWSKLSHEEKIPNTKNTLVNISNSGLLNFKINVK